MQNLILDQALLDLIEQGPISEYQIINKFKAEPYNLFNPEVMNNNLSLFQTHFVLFNALYRLRDVGLKLNLFDIDIISSRIEFVPFSSSANVSKSALKSNSDLEENLNANNPPSASLGLNQAGSMSVNPLANRLSEKEHNAVAKLRQYYLNWNNFEKTTQQNVCDLIDSFWQSMSTKPPTQLSNDNLTNALHVLELEQCVALTDLKKQYKKLSNLHHPDKGGNLVKFQKITLAYQYLKQQL